MTMHKDSNLYVAHFELLRPIAVLIFESLMTIQQLYFLFSLILYNNTMNFIYLLCLIEN